MSMWSGGNSGSVECGCVARLTNASVGIAVVYGLTVTTVAWCSRSNDLKPFE